jgi:MYXO-CTERM domain-containing protein
MGKNKASLLGVVCAAWVLSLASAQAQLVSWNLQGNTGQETSEPGISSSSGVTAMDITRGSGLTALNSGTNGFTSDHWNSESGDYFSFGFTVQEGFSVNLTDLVLGSRSSNSGPGQLGLYYSGDGFALSLGTFSQSGTAYTNSTFDLTALANLTGTVEFRIIQIGTTSANGGTTGTGGTFRLTNYFNPTDVGYMGFSGTVTAVPEPSGAMWVGCSGLFLFVLRRRRRA